MTLVGLPDAAVQESRERVQTAIKNAGLHFPRHRIVVNLSPASIRKEGPAYDLPIALGVIILSGCPRHQTQSFPGAHPASQVFGLTFAYGAFEGVRAFNVAGRKIVIVKGISIKGSGDKYHLGQCSVPGPGSLKRGAKARVMQARFPGPEWHLGWGAEGAPTRQA